MHPTLFAVLVIACLASPLIAQAKSPGHAAPAAVSPPKGGGVIGLNPQPLPPITRAPQLGAGR